MKRIALLVCALVLMIANTAEARRTRRSNYRTYTRPVAAAPVASAPQPTTSEAERPAVATASAEDDSPEADGASDTQVKPASHAASTEATAKAETKVKTVSYSTATAQGVANRMARDGRVGHYGGNRGYEGCGCGATQAAAYNVCCYANSGMRTVDVGYARGANGMWYCCRRYR